MKQGSTRKRLYSVFAILTLFPLYYFLVVNAHTIDVVGDMATRALIALLGFIGGILFSAIYIAAAMAIALSPIIIVILLLKLPEKLKQ